MIVSHAFGTSTPWIALRVSRFWLLFPTVATSLFKRVSEGFRRYSVFETYQMVATPYWVLLRTEIHVSLLERNSNL
jgi:hypothetical protein